MWGSLEQIQRDWDRHAETDPLWAILTHPDMKGGKWDEAAFFETGRQEIERVVQYAGALGVDLGRGTALDFGCGVGRLTRALAARFGQVYGVDISPVMVERARQLNRQVGNCTFVQVPDPDFATLPARDFDFIYSNITLQHIPPRHSRRYIPSLLRLLRPGGLMVFELAGESRATPVGRLWLIVRCRLRRYLTKAEPLIEVYGLPKHRVLDLLARGGGRLIDVKENVGALPDWTCYRYAVVRRHRDGK